MQDFPKGYVVDIRTMIMSLSVREVSPGTALCLFDGLGDRLVWKAAAKALKPFIGRPDLVVMPDGKAQGLLYALCDELNMDWGVILRKKVKPYMKVVDSVTFQSITSGGKEQALYLTDENAAALKGKTVLICDDVVSTGESLRATGTLVERAGGIVQGVAAVFTEGPDPDASIITLGNLPLFKRGEDGVVRTLGGSFKQPPTRR